VNLNSGVQSNPVRFDRRAERGLFNQMSGPLCQTRLINSRVNEQPMCRLKITVFLTRVWFRCNTASVAEEDPPHFFSSF